MNFQYPNPVFIIPMQLFKKEKHMYQKSHLHDEGFRMQQLSTKILNSEKVTDQNVNLVSKKNNHFLAKTISNFRKSMTAYEYEVSMSPEFSKLLFQNQFTNSHRMNQIFGGKKIV